MSLDIFTLLTFPKTSDAFSNYTPGLPTLATPKETVLRSNSGCSSSSPPRKTARLDGDNDHSDATNRRRQKGKTKEGMLDRTTGNAVKKLVLINPPQEDGTEKYVDSLLPGIHRSICVLLDRPASSSKPKIMPMSCEGLYQATRNVVLMSGKGQWILDKLKFELNQAIQGLASRLLAFQPTGAVHWLMELVAAANWFNSALQLLVVLFTYLDRVYLLQKPETPGIREMAMSLFRAHIFDSVMITDKLIEGINEWVGWERSTRNAHPDRATITELLGILHTYGMYTPLFLDPYIRLTQSFYAAESARLALPGELQDNPQAFLEHCDKRIVEEKGRSGDVLGSYQWCWRDIEIVTERSLLEGRLPWLSKGLAGAVDSRNVDGLERMYTLFSGVDGLKLLCDAFKSHVHQKVQNIVLDAGQEEQMVERLLDFKAFLDIAIPLAFASAHSPAPPAPNPPPSPVKIEPKTEPGVSTFSFTTSAASATQAASTDADAHAPHAPVRITNKEFAYAAADAFQTGFRARRNKPAELIAKHIDRAMRKGQRGESDENFFNMLDACLALYRYTEDKDVFRTFYHRALAKRLLLQRSASDDFEKSVLKRLEKLDPEFVMGEKMFKDLDLSRDSLRLFHEKPVGLGSAQKMSVLVLQRSEWPFSPKENEEVLLPATMQEDLSKYTKFYTDSHANRVLHFAHSLGTMQLRARFNPGEKELSVSLFQGVILLLFNQQEEIGFAEIKIVLINIRHALLMFLDDAELRRTLQSLACGNKKVLKKRPAGRDVDDTDVFVFNPDFTDPRPKVHINSIQSKETPEETKRTHTAIDGDRKHHLDAAIVRIMKAKKSVTHQQLIPATIEAVKRHFVPDVKVIKERIEQLIEQEYMRRDDEVDNLYVYMA